MQLTIATVEEQRQRDRLTNDAWGERLTPEQFIAREERLRAHAWPRAALTTWFLRSDSEAVLASLETYRMRSFLDGNVGQSVGIASVFTEPALRGRGHATRLMDLVMARVRQEMPATHAMILFSDVGAPIYERSGYQARPAADLVFPPATGSPGATSELLFDEREALARFAALAPPAERFIIWPTAEQLDWHFERARAYAALLNRPALAHSGARLGDSLIVWCADWKHDRLQVLLLESAQAHEAEALVATARRAAATTGLHEVRLWAEPWSFTGRADLGGDRLVRRDSLPMIAPLAPSLRPDEWTCIPRAVWM